MLTVLGLLKPSSRENSWLFSTLLWHFQFFSLPFVECFPYSYFLCTILFNPFSNLQNRSYLSILWRNKKKLRETNFSKTLQLIISRANLLWWTPVQSHSKICALHFYYCSSIQQNHKFLCSRNKLVINSALATTIKKTKQTDFTFSACYRIALKSSELNFSGTRSLRSLYDTVTILMSMTK